MKYLLDCLKCTNDDEEFFLTHEKYYKGEFDLDVLGELGLAIEKEGADSGESGPQTDTE